MTRFFLYIFIVISIVVISFIIRRTISAHSLVLFSAVEGIGIFAVVIQQSLLVREKSKWVTKVLIDGSKSYG